MISQRPEGTCPCQTDSWIGVGRLPLGVSPLPAPAGSFGFGDVAAQAQFLERRQHRSAVVPTISHQLALVVLALTLVFVGLSCRPALDKAVTQEPWVVLLGPWTSAPRESGIAAWNSARVMRFKPDHTFSMLFCVVHRGYSSDKLAITRGEAWTLFDGHWRQKGRKGLEVTYRKIDEDLSAIGSSDPREMSMRLTLECQGLCIRNGSEIFRQIETLDHDAYDEVIDSPLEYERTHKGSA